MLVLGLRFAVRVYGLGLGTGMLLWWMEVSELGFGAWALHSVTTGKEWSTIVRVLVDDCER